MSTVTSPTTELDPKSICVRFMFSYQRRDVAGMLDYCSGDATIHFLPLGDAGNGKVRELGKAIWEGLIASFPDLDNTVDLTVATDNDDIRCQVVIRGTQAADFADIQNKGLHFESDHIFIFRLNDADQIEHISIEWDHADLKKQLGN